MKKQIIRKGFLILVSLLALNSCKNDDDTSGSTNVTGNCDTNTASLEILNFSITEFELTNDNSLNFYEIPFTFDIKNNGSEAVNLNNTRIQTYLSTDDELDEEDQSAGEFNASFGNVDEENTIVDQGRTASSIELDDPLSIDDLYLLVEIDFFGEANCGLIISYKINNPNEEEDKALIPSITNLDPSAGFPGRIVTITGTNYSSTIDDNEVTFNDIEAEILSASATELTVQLPEDSTSGPVLVSVNEVISEEHPIFTVNEMPQYTIEDNCDSGDTPVEILNFRITEIELTNNNDKDFYVIRSTFDIRNNSDTEINIQETIIQAYLSNDGQFDSGDDPAGGYRIVNERLIAPGETYNTGASSNSSARDNPLDIDDLYLFISIDFFEDPDCDALIGNEIDFDLF